MVENRFFKYISKSSEACLVCTRIIINVYMDHKILLLVMTYNASTEQENSGSTSFSRSLFCCDPFWRCPFCCWSILEQTFFTQISQKLFFLFSLFLIYKKNFFCLSFSVFFFSKTVEDFFVYF